MFINLFNNIFFTKIYCSTQDYLNSIFFFRPEDILNVSIQSQEALLSSHDEMEKSDANQRDNVDAACDVVTQPRCAIHHHHYPLQ